MAPSAAKSNVAGRTSAQKRKKADDVSALRDVNAAQSGGDSLSTPGVAGALSRLCSRKLSADNRKAVEDALRKLRADLGAFPHESAPLTEAETTRRLRKVDARVRPSDSVIATTDAPGKLASIAVVGSFLLNYNSPTALGADVAVIVPAGFYGDRDVANYRYHQKRALFLAYLARYLEGCDGRWEVSVTGALGGNSAKPALRVSEKSQDGASKVFLTILPGFEEGEIPEDKLDKRRRNVRKAGESSVVDDVALGTPGYNDSILMDSRLVSHLQTLHKSSSKAANFVPAVRMLVAWCNRRRLLTGSFIPAALVASLLSQRRVQASATAAHIFRVALARIKAGELPKLMLDGVCVSSQQDHALLDRMKEESASSLVIIDSPVSSLDPWRGVLPALFVSARGAKAMPVPLATLFDGFVIADASKKAGKLQLVDGTLVDVLQKAFVQVGRAYRVERLNQNLFGITLSKASDALRKVDLCPASTDENDFKAFWGDKVQLRRFNDGKIKRSLVWDGGIATMDNMLQHAAARHLDESITVSVVLSQLQTKSGLSEQDAKTGTHLLAAMNELGKTLRGLEGLPLRIVNISGVSAHLRHAAVQTVRPHSNGKFIDPVEVIAFFESSKSWPNDPVAISASKAAFYVALRGALSGQGLSAKATISYLDVFLGDFVFRTRISVEQEKKSLDDKSADHAHLVWQTEGRVSVQNILRNAPTPLLGPVSRLAKRWLSSHLLFSQFGDRAEEFVELLCLRALEGPNGRAPNSAQVGFFRFLHLLAEFPWETAPVVISATDEMDVSEGAVSDSLADHRTEEAYEEAFRVFEAQGNARPGIALTCPIEDPFAWFHRSHSPDRSIVKRMVAAARASLDCGEGILAAKHEASRFRMMFLTPVEGVYHLALHLDPSVTPRAQKLKKGFMRSKGHVSGMDSSFVDFDPVEMLLEKLESELNEEAWFMLDSFGGSCINVGWRPRAFKPRPFSIKAMRFSVPNVETGMLEPNRKEMVEVMLRIGDGVISGVRYLQSDEALPDSQN